MTLTLTCPPARGSTPRHGNSCGSSSRAWAAAARARGGLYVDGAAAGTADETWRPPRPTGAGACATRAGPRRCARWPTTLDSRWSRSTRTTAAYYVRSEHAEADRCRGGPDPARAHGQRRGNRRGTRARLPAHDRPVRGRRRSHRGRLRDPSWRNRSATAAWVRTRDNLDADDSRLSYFGMRIFRPGKIRSGLSMLLTWARRLVHAVACPDLGEGVTGLDGVDLLLGCLAGLGARLLWASWRASWRSSRFSSRASCRFSRRRRPSRGHAGGARRPCGRPRGTPSPPPASASASCRAWSAAPSPLARRREACLVGGLVGLAAGLFGCACASTLALSASACAASASFWASAGAGVVGGQRVLDLVPHSIGSSSRWGPDGLVPRRPGHCEVGRRDRVHNALRVGWPGRAGAGSHTRRVTHPPNRPTTRSPSRPRKGSRSRCGRGGARACTMRRTG